MTTKVFVLLTIIVSSAFSTSNRRILNGENVKNKLPYMACLLYDPGVDILWIKIKQKIYPDNDYYELLCGGSILNSKWILTVAHCITEGKDRLHYVGVDGLNFRKMGAYHKIVSKIVHPDFDPSTLTTVSDNDIGLIKTETKIKNFNSPMGHVPESTTVWDHPIMMYGWGRTETGEKSKTLRQIEVELALDVENYCKIHRAVQAGRTLCFRVPKHDGSSGGGDSGSPIVLKAVNSFEKDSIGSLVSSGSLVKYNGSFHVQGPNITYYIPWITKTTKIN